ncbi:hypothetical protein [Pseudomonas brassicacearum]|uniref:Uncharacterized protein n=1 Tax=Pseudomonas brassicacearum TaxID=930166 RepID=A0A423GKN9_9PSED|nr:hypothetical protein [Pseudomonas brassicacearum]ROM91080.1 hypothetical protein BK658_24605 [Pseudomonas brassicacearum]
MITEVTFSKVTPEVDEKQIKKDFEKQIKAAGRKISVLDVEINREKNTAVVKFEGGPATTARAKSSSIPKQERFNADRPFVYFVNAVSSDGKLLRLFDQLEGGRQ